MQSPPPYSVSGKKKSSVGLIIFIVVMCLAICCVVPTALLVKGGMDIFKNSSGMIGCATDMSATRDGLVAYARKHNGELPEATDWKKDIEPFLKQPVMQPPFKAPSLESGICDPQGRTSICYNSAVAGKKTSDVEDKDAVVLFEASTGTVPNAANNYVARPLEESPKIIGNQPRGWVLIGISEDAYIIGKNGHKARIGNVSEGGGVKITTEPGSKK